MFRFSSLGTQFSVTVLATAMLTFAIFLGLTIFSLDRSIDEQTRQIQVLSEKQIAKEMNAHSRLAIARLNEISNNVSRRLENISQRSDIIRAVSSGNVVAINEVLGRASQLADLDGIVVIDTNFNAIGAHSDQVQLLEVNKLLLMSSLAAPIQELLQNNDRKNTRILQEVVDLKAPLITALGAKAEAPYVMVSVIPLFDDYGEIFAALIGHRALRSTEATLVELTKIESGSVVIQYADKIISSAGRNQLSRLTQKYGEQLSITENGNLLGSCNIIHNQYEVCALEPISELHALTNTMVHIAQSEGQVLVKWLTIISAASLVLFGVLLYFLLRQVTIPIKNITDVVRSVAQGDWKSHVVGTERRDEIGDIAKAVVVLQKSMEERDLLRVDVANAEALNQRRLALEESIQKFDGMMRSVLLSVSDSTDTMEQIAQELTRFSSITEGEAAEVAFVTDHTLDNVQKLTSLTEQLGKHLIANSTAEQVKHISENYNFLQQMHQLSDTLSSTNVAMLNSISDSSSKSPSQRDIQDISLYTRSMSEIITMNLNTLNLISLRLRGEDGEEFHLLAHEMDFVVQCIELIGQTIKHQELLIDDIASGIKTTATGTSSVAASVERLRSSMEEARAASIKVVGKAGEVNEEARKLDLTVKSFLREVAIYEQNPPPIPVGRLG